jgi:NAD(P)-dependent dehydrogenase (short-subunit alcohol dehydrogenase family)
MDLQNKVCVVTGAASGIGLALARAFSAEGARVVVSDVDADGIAVVGEELSCLAVVTDVSSSEAVLALIDQTEAEVGPVDLFFSNAGVAAGEGPEAPDEVWERSWGINTMAHVYAARHLLPRMVERGSGYLASTASAAGMLMEPRSAPYTVTKHAALALAEWIAVNYGDKGVSVSVLCPQAVNTPMARDDSFSQLAAVDGFLEPEQVAQEVVDALRVEAFLITPHPKVRGYEQYKAKDRDAWLAGMRRATARLEE